MATDIPNLEFTADGQYDINTPERAAAAAEACLRSIATFPIAYWSRGPEYCRDEMARIAGELASRLQRQRRARQSAAEVR
jgi:hypothetical protein